MNSIVNPLYIIHLSDQAKFIILENQKKNLVGQLLPDMINKVELYKYSHSEPGEKCKITRVPDEQNYIHLNHIVRIEKRDIEYEIVES